MTITDDLYRSIMSRYAAGVTVVTATDRSGTHFGLTVSAFCAVSLRPPLVLVCVDNASNTLPVIQDSMAYTVNIMGHDSHDIALRFASKADDKFSGGDLSFTDSATGPILDADAVAYLNCRVTHNMEAGDHHVFIGLVEDGRLTANEARPLVYCDREFGHMVAVTL